MPPPKPHKHDKRHLPASRALRFVDAAQLDALLATLVPEKAEREFVQRCLVDEGPLHHRGANYLLLRLLGLVLARVPGVDAPLTGERVPMRLPPHLEDEVEEGHFPVPLPTHALRELLGDDEQAMEAAIDCLTDGPPQHALANVVMVALLERLLARLEKKG
ncbi:MAG: hypothetical protein Q8N23_28700 [Archangium sp.]|nr:hypothetical protein [Archangium sp.]MDP3570627.1 hypothetical protein [Archangium sp.]